MKSIAAVAVMAALVAGSSAQAQHIVSVYTRSYIPVFTSLPVVCGDGMAAAGQARQALLRWEQPLYSRGDNENALICATNAALAGDTGAQTLLGRMYSHVRTNFFGGEVAPEYGSPEDALYWFEKASAGDDGRGAFEAGQMYEMGVGTSQDDERARAAYQRAGDLGYKRARAAIEKLDSRDTRSAQFMARQQVAIDKGSGKAMRVVAVAYINGDPFRPDDAKGFDWMLKAAEAGDVQAQSEVGLMYARGVGTARDDNAAVDWLMKASSSRQNSDDRVVAIYYGGGLDAEHRAKVEAASQRGQLIDMFGQRLKAAPRQPETTTEPAYNLAELEKGAAKHERLATYNLAIVYQEGKGVPIDMNRARALFETIADQDSDAALNLGDMYYTGKLGAADHAQAAKWYGLAAAMDEGLGARNALAIYRDGGPGVTADPVKAYALAALLRRLTLGENDDVETRLGAGLSPEDRARGLAWLNRLLLEHHRS